MMDDRIEAVARAYVANARKWEGALVVVGATEGFGCHLRPCHTANSSKSDACAGVQFAHRVPSQSPPPHMHPGLEQRQRQCGAPFHIASQAP